MKLISLTEESPYNHCFINFLRFIYKFIRIIYVSFFFYFAPFAMLAYQFHLVHRHKDDDEYVHIYWKDWFK